MLREQLKSLPKAELHAHLEGSVTPGCLQILAEKNGVSLTHPTIFPGTPPIPPPRRELLSSNFSGSFLDFISLYAKITSAIRSAEDIQLVAAQYAAAAAAENILAAQLYVSPTTFKYLGVSAEVLAEGLREAEVRAKTNHGVSLTWIFDIVRNSPVPGDETLELAEFCRKRNVRVQAIGLGGLERGYPGKAFISTFQRARALGYNILIHAGETVGPESVWEAVEVLQADRIGHGISAATDQRLLDELQKRGTIVEVSPWSNICLGNADATSHPLRQMIEAGVQVVIAADDPGIFGKNLTDNYLFAAEQGISLECLREVAKRSIEVAFSTAG